MEEWQRTLRHGDNVDVDEMPESTATAAQLVDASIAQPTESVLEPVTSVRQGGFGPVCGTSRGSARRRLGYHCERDKAELPSDQGDDVADAVIKDAEEWSDDSDEWWLAGHYDGEEVEVWVAGQDE
ncbi:unnamed protein product [Closterium sp. NIES-64]|nr:unnamed protein product [Closterium sp. NIES-64]